MNGLMASACTCQWLLRLATSSLGTPRDASPLAEHGTDAAWPPGAVGQGPCLQMNKNPSGTLLTRINLQPVECHLLEQMEGLELNPLRQCKRHHLHT